LNKNDVAPGGDDLLAVGKIVKPHGIRGALVVEVLSDWPERFAPGSKLLVEVGNQEFREVTVESAAPYGKGMRVFFFGVTDREAALNLRDLYLLAPASNAAPLAEGEYWAHDLKGMKLVEEDGSEHGEVLEVVCRAAQDLLMVTAADGTEFGVPLVSEFIRGVDMEKRVITVNLPNGMAP